LAVVVVRKEGVMDISKAVALELPCNVCGGRYPVTLAQMRLGELVRHEGCRDVQGERECLPEGFAGLLDVQSIAAFEQAWGQLEARAHLLGGTLTINTTEGTQVGLLQT